MRLTLLKLASWCLIFTLAISTSSLFAQDVISGYVFIDYDGDGVYEGAPLNLEEKVPTIRVNVYDDVNGNGLLDPGEPLIESSAPTDVLGEYSVSIPTGLASNYLVLIEPADLEPNTTLLTSPNVIGTYSYAAGEGLYTDTNLGFKGEHVVCYSGSDLGDFLVAVNRFSGEAINLGTFTATNPISATRPIAIDIEAVTFSLDGETFYAPDGGHMGTINLSNGEFTYLPQAVGSGDGLEAGVVANVAMTDLDGLAFDPLTGIMYGAERNNGEPEDMLVQIDPTTGALIPGVFAGGYDFVEIENVSSQNGDIDDIAINSADGQMYGVCNGRYTGGGSIFELLVKIDKFTGAATLVDTMRYADGRTVTDVEGFGFTNFGKLLITTGNKAVDPADYNTLFEMDLNTAVVNKIGTLPIGSDYEGTDCLTAAPNIITGTVFEDLNGSQLLDNSEVGIPTVSIIIKVDLNNDGIGDVIADVIETDGQGEYYYETGSNVAFTIEIDESTLPAGYVMTTDNIETANFLDGFGGLEDANNDFGAAPGATIGDFVWEDTNGDGIQDPGETGIDGVLVTLYASDGTVVGTTTTVNGSYSFTDVPAGEYYMGFGTPTGYSASPANQGGDPTQDSDIINPISGVTAPFSLSPGDVNNDIDAGFVPGTTGSTISGSTWLDSNANGTDDGETPIQGITVDLYDSNGTLIASTTTGPDGSYTFSNVPPGDYYVDFGDSPGNHPTMQDAGNDDTIDSDANPTNGQTQTFTVTAGTDVTDVDAGYYPGITIGDFVWNDKNKDGIQDTSEPGIGGASVVLYDAAGNFVERATTLPDGSYSFEDLPAGSYFLEFTQPGIFWIPSPADQGGNDNADSDINPITLTTPLLVLNAGDPDRDDLDAGFYFGEPGPSIGDFIWVDDNEDGLQTAGEVGLEAVAVNLYTSSGTLLATTFTDATGFYEFKNLPVGIYYLEMDMPMGYDLTQLGDGTLDRGDSDFDPNTNRTNDFVIVSGAPDNFDLDGGLIAGALPVELISFEGEDKNCQIVLTWSTASEVNNSHFEIQKSTDGNNFTKIGEVAGNGTTFDMNSYEFVDREISIKNYYRIKQVDFDSDYSFTKVITVKSICFTENVDNGISLIFPNPVGQESVFIKFYTNLDQPATVEVYDAVGRLATREGVSLSQGTNLITLPTNKLAPGTYTLLVKGEGWFSKAQKLVKVK